MEIEPILFTWAIARRIWAAAAGRDDDDDDDDEMVVGGRMPAFTAFLSSMKCLVLVENPSEVFFWLGLSKHEGRFEETFSPAAKEETTPKFKMLASLWRSTWLGTRIRVLTKSGESYGTTILNDTDSNTPRFG